MRPRIEITTSVGPRESVSDVLASLLRPYAERYGWSPEALAEYVKDLRPDGVSFYDWACNVRAAFLKEAMGNA